MSWKPYLAVTLLTLLVLVILAGFQASPGYMDAEYYYSMGLRIAKGKGLGEPFVWNYLTPVEAIPHPGFTYWMPVPAFISAVGLWITGWETFLGARWVHVLIAAFIPAIAMRIAWGLTSKNSTAVLAGALAVFPAFYSVFLGTTDSFGIIMLLGGIFFLVCKTDRGREKFIGLGAICGLMHLTRADGLIWLAAAGYGALLSNRKRYLNLLDVVVGYLIIMAPWFARNTVIFGSLMPSGTSRAFWLQEYNDLFTYYPQTLTFENWVSQGWTAIFEKIKTAGLANIKNALLVQGQVILTPFMLIGAWKHRQDRAVQGVFLAWLGVFLLMSIVFPFAGLRGGFTHSGAAFQPLLWALAGCGFYTIIGWGVKRRNWIQCKAGVIFGSALVMLVAIASIFIYHNRVIGEDFRQPIWENAYQDASGIGVALEELGSSADELIMINNPPGFYAATGRSAIVIPNGGVEDLLAAGSDFGAKILVLERNHPQNLTALYNAPGEEDRLEYLGKWNHVAYFRLP